MSVILSPKLVPTEYGRELMGSVYVNASAVEDQS